MHQHHTMEYKNNVSLSQLPITVIESHATELIDLMYTAT
jgi:hypothetical protein